LLILIDSVHFDIRLPRVYNLVKIGQYERKSSELQYSPAISKWKKSMKSKEKEIPTIFAIFGGGGDLAWRKLVPALFDLFQDRTMPRAPGDQNLPQNC
jgi:hypothetical protein